MAELAGSAKARTAASGRIFLVKVMCARSPLGIPFPRGVSDGVPAPSMGRSGQLAFSPLNERGPGGHVPRRRWPPGTWLPEASAADRDRPRRLGLVGRPVASNHRNGDLDLAAPQHLR